MSLVDTRCVCENAARNGRLCEGKEGLIGKVKRGCWNRANSP